MLNDFKQFVMKGNVVDLAVAVVVGAAFSAVVNGFVTDLLNPAISATFGKPDFSSIVFYVHRGKFEVGTFLNAAISFLLVTTAVYIFLVAPMNAVKRRMHRNQPPAPPTTKICPECISEVNVNAKRCAHCGVIFAELQPASAAPAAPTQSAHG